MSFQLVCQNCGSVSGPSVGICPFCKSILTSRTAGEYESALLIHKNYAKGNLPTALSLARKIYEIKPEQRLNVHFLLTYTKILIDVEAPSSQIKSILNEAFLLAPHEQEVLDYIELVDLWGRLKRGTDSDAAESVLKLIHRSPKNPHAYFILGTHYYWAVSGPLSAIPYLESCLRLAPSHLRAWGCLGAIYKKIGNSPLAKQAFQKCLEIEMDPNMRQLFEKELSSVS
jgi:tetratricopeptide (TPR) repeat protein